MRIAFFSAALLASGTLIAATPIDGWYSSAFGGYTYLPDNLYHSTPYLYRNHTRYDAGYNAGGRLGFKSNPMRYEGEVTYLHSNLKRYYTTPLQSNRIKGSTSATAAMVNIYYDFHDFVPAIQPFLGIGLGYAWVEGRLNNADTFGTANFKASDGVFAYQATAGLAYNFAENYALDIAYRFLGTQHIEPFGRRLQANLATLGATYRFNELSYK
jgi:opacity protein-like surface antigen